MVTITRPGKGDVVRLVTSVRHHGTTYTEGLSGLVRAVTDKYGGRALVQIVYAGGPSGPVRGPEIWTDIAALAPATPSDTKRVLSVLDPRPVPQMVKSPFDLAVEACGKLDQAELNRLFEMFRPAPIPLERAPEPAPVATPAAPEPAKLPPSRAEMLAELRGFFENRA